MTPAPSLTPTDKVRSVTATAQRPIAGGGLLGALWTLYVLTLRQYVHGKRWMVLGLLFLLPAGLAVIARITAPDVPPAALEFILAMMFIPQALLPLVALLYASGIIQDEQEEQTITYLLVRPIPKWAMYVVKLLAAMTTAVLLTVVFTGVTYAAIYVGSKSPVENIPLRCLKAASIHGLAIISYCSLFGLLSLVTKRTLVVGILYTAIVEGLLANLPFAIRLATVIYYTRLIAYRSLDFVVSVPREGDVDLAAQAWQFDLQADPKLLEHPQIATCLTVLLVGSLLCTILAAWLCTRREFHVKTPEQD